jgi:2,3-bisphosphoglycerate-dependent phosphoglycerate mutase
MHAPLRIFLVRHGESLGNLDRHIYHQLPDHRVPLSPEGQHQATAAGAFLRDWLTANPPTGRCRLHFSPYLRTRDTADAMLKVLGRREQGGLVDDSAANLHLIEQRFGLFDGLWEDQMETQLPMEYAHYQRTRHHAGRFWAMMPEGDSPYDVALRVHQCFGGIHRDAEAGFRDVIVVAHGVSIRAFLMMWLHLDPDWYEAEPNPLNCSVRLLEAGAGETLDRGYIYAGFAKRPEVLRNEAEAEGGT